MKLPMKLVKLRRLTKAQLKVLENLIEGRPAGQHIQGRSASGGFSATCRSLKHAMLVDSAAYPTRITQAGRLSYEAGYVLGVE